MRTSSAASRRHNTDGSRMRLLALVLAAVACALCLADTALSQSKAGTGDGDPNQHQRIPPAFAEGQTIVQVYVHLMNPTGDPAKDEQAKQEIADTLGIRPGAAFNVLVTEAGVAKVRALPAVQEVEYRLYSSEGGGEVTLALLATRQVAAAHPLAPAKGTFASGKVDDLPKLWHDERSLLKLIVNPSFGIYADHNAWLGNPGAFVGLPEQKQTLGVMEAGLEFGIGGITRLGESNAYVYGAASYIGSTTQGRDVFTAESSRAHGEMEDLYAGFLIAKKGTKRSLNISAGRQKFALNRNLLIGHVLGASNGSDRAASNLSPRNAYDMTVDARFQLGNTTIQAWLADPNELPQQNSRSRYAGVNFKYIDNKHLDASLTYLEATRSAARYPTPDGRALSRQGLRAINPRARWNVPFGIKGLWFEAEWAHEWNKDFDMSADGGGIWAGYMFTKAPWRPSILYRYAVMTGDNPATRTYERFDTLTGGVQRDWAQGMDMIKVAINRNLRTHRFEVSAKPTQGLELSVDYYYFTADELNNLGGQPPVRNYAANRLGQEVTPTLQWLIGQSLFIQALTTFLVPGEGIKNVLPERSRVWQTYQLSFYCFF